MSDTMESRGGKRAMPGGRREVGRVLPNNRQEETQEQPLELTPLDDLDELMVLDPETDEAPEFPPKTLEDEGEDIPLLLPTEELVEPEEPEMPEELEEPEESNVSEEREEPEPPQAERAAEAPAPKKKKPSLWSRAFAKAENLTDRVMDWTEDLTDRFDDMASDPENDSLAARMIRGSEHIVEGLEDQQWETDQETAQEEKYRASRQQPKRERKVPRFVFYQAENAPKGEDPGIPDPPVNPNQRKKTPEERRESAPAFSPEGEEGGVTPESLTQRAAPTAPSKDKTRRRERHPEPKHQAPGAERPAITPISKRERKQVRKLARSLQYWAFLLALGGITVVGLCSFLRVNYYSYQDLRTLAEKPSISLSGLWSGDYFSLYEQWYSDTYPTREDLAKDYDKLYTIGLGQQPPVVISLDAYIELYGYPDWMEPEEIEQMEQEKAQAAETEEAETVTPSQSPEESQTGEGEA